MQIQSRPPSSPQLFKKLRPNELNIKAVSLKHIAGLTAQTLMVKDFISKFLSLIRLATVLLNDLEFDCSKTPPFNRTPKIYALLGLFQANQSERIGDTWQNV